MVLYTFWKKMYWLPERIKTGSLVPSEPKPLSVTCNYHKTPMYCFNKPRLRLVLETYHCTPIQAFKLPKLSTLKTACKSKIYIFKSLSSLLNSQVQLGKMLNYLSPVLKNWLIAKYTSFSLVCTRINTTACYTGTFSTTCLTLNFIFK